MYIFQFLQFICYLATLIHGNVLDIKNFMEIMYKMYNT